MSQSIGQLLEAYIPLMPADAGIQFFAKGPGPRFRGDERIDYALRIRPATRGPPDVCTLVL